MIVYLETEFGETARYIYDPINAIANCQRGQDVLHFVRYQSWRHKLFGSLVKQILRRFTTSFWNARLKKHQRRMVKKKMKNTALEARKIPRENIDLSFLIPAKLCIHWFSKLENLKRAKNSNCNFKSYIGSSQRENLIIEEPLYMFSVTFCTFPHFLQILPDEIGKTSIFVKCV